MLLLLLLLLRVGLAIYLKQNFQYSLFLGISLIPEECAVTPLILHHLGALMWQLVHSNQWNGILSIEHVIPVPYYGSVLLCFIDMIQKGPF